VGWAKFDDQFTDHPKVVAAGPMAELLAVRAVIHCARYETDGHVQAAQLPRLALGITSPKKQVAALVKCGLWEEDADGNGWWVHDFLDYHPSAEQKEQEREQARERMANVRKKKGRSSDDVRPNTDRSSDYPDPSRTPPQDQELSSAVADPEVSQEARDLTRQFALAVKANGFPVPADGQKNRVKWLEDMDRLLRLGAPGGDPQPQDAREVAKVIAFATEDDFWKANVRSPAKFREQFPTLRLRMLNQTPALGKLGTGGVAS